MVQGERVQKAENSGADQRPQLLERLDGQSDCNRIFSWGHGRGAGSTG